MLLRMSTGLLYSQYRQFMSRLNITSQSDKILVLDGARQIGKSFLFGEQEEEGAIQ